MRLFFLAILAIPLTAQSLTDRYCTACHNPQSKAGNFILTGQDPAKAGANAAIWEKVLRQVSSGQMPPPGLPRPKAEEAKTFLAALTASLDKAASERPNPGSTMPHRLNRTEYSNAIRDLLGLDIQAGAGFPVDESGNGFDNMADLLSMSPALLERYMSAARSISLLAVGNLSQPADDTTYSAGSRSQRRTPDPEDLPLGANGGMVARHYFPLDAEYEIKVVMTGGGNASAAQTTPFKWRMPIKAGLHNMLATFTKDDTRPEAATRVFGRFPGPPQGGIPGLPPIEMDLRFDGASLKRFQVTRRANALADVASIVVSGPYNATGKGNPPSRTAIFLCPTQDDACATRILTHLSRRAFRRPVTDADVRPLLAFYKNAGTKDFDLAIGNAIRALLVSPDFLFRIERDPKGAPRGSAQPLSDHELASRLSFFLWSSIPDEELSRLADEGKLKDPAVRRAQVARMLDDPKADALPANFGGQWLFLRTLANARPDADLFPSFDDALRRAFQRETELTLTSLFRSDQSVLKLLDAEYSFLNQRLAEHYKIPNVYGSHFRRVVLPPDSPRGGLLGQGSILTVTSYPNRTSVVQRGKWILENLLSTPPPPAPANVPELEAKAKDGRTLSLREAMDIHRANAICKGCHARMDPIGFALENFDGIGAWRNDDSGLPIDAKGTLPNGNSFDGPGGLKKLLLEKHREEFVETIAEKMLIYALGRGLEPQDRPVVRAISRRAATENYRLRAFVTAIVESVPFLMRRTSDQ